MITYTSDIVNDDGRVELEAKLVHVLLLERSPKVVRVFRLESHDRRVGPGVTHVEESLDLDSCRLEPLLLECRLTCRLELRQSLKESRPLGVVPVLGSWLLRLLSSVGEGEAVCTEDGRVAVDDDSTDTERLGDLARVLTTSSTERRETGKRARKPESQLGLYGYVRRRAGIGLTCALRDRTRAPL